jgi:6-pyruvoyltetrahydropterin/6-carboxytetrahydropterin synthase
MTFEVGVVGSVRASHVMPGLPLPEGEPHFHDYRIDVTIERDGLDDAGVLIDLDALRRALHATMAEVAGADLSQHLEVPAVTVERFAGWVHGRIAEAIGDLPGATIRVRIWEGPEAFGGYSAPAG